MAARKRNTDNALITCLKKLGCVFCPECYAYMYPDHQEHSSIAVDAHASHYKLVGGYGDVRLVDLNDEAA